jgi:peptide/nickel transport system permease protein
MVVYILRRLIILPVIILLVTFILFAILLQMPPEQRAEIYLPSMKPTITTEQRAEIIQKAIDRYGLDKPLTVQYVNWMRNLAIGQWGYSPEWRQPVLEGLISRAPASAELLVLSSIPAIIMALVLGSLAAKNNNRLSGQVIRVVTFIAWAFPSFILALLLLNFFYAWQGWFPPGRLTFENSALVASVAFRNYTGMYTIDALLNRNWSVFLDATRHLVLPSITLAAAIWALLTRIMRASLLDVLNQDFITTARSKGIREGRVINRHGRRNAVLPVISTGGVAVSLLLSSLVVVESVYNYGGIGKAAVEAILLGDVPVVVGFTLFVSIITVLLTLVADILYGVVDPRARLY